MNQTRRYAIKQIFAVAAGAALIPSCMEDKSKASVILTNFKIDADQEKLLAELAEAIIPKTTTPGAKDISAHLFALKMIDDCAKPEDQQKFVKGLEQFDKTFTAQFVNRFVDSAKDHKVTFLAILEAKKDEGNELAFFYGKMKQLTIQAYTASQFYLTKVRVYELVPGRFHGCVPVTTA